MKIPLEWLSQYVKLNKSPKDISESFSALGLMLDKPLNDKVLDLEHRFDRSDWLSILGCARDYAAYEGLPLVEPQVKSHQAREATKETKVEIKVECPDLVHRFNTRVFKNIKVSASPDWLKTRLEEYGIASINNIVDITNYVMVEFGQPMHAQDLAKFEKREILIRRAKAGESLTTFLGEKVELDDESFVLTQGGKPIVLGGIVGGRETGVTSETTEIVLDAGNYDQNSVRKTSRRLKILNETVLRYDKFLHPKLTEPALDRATDLILELAGGEYYENVDYYPKPQGFKTMTLRMERLELLSGMNFELDRVIEILTAIGYKIISNSLDDIKVEVPYFRTDVEVEDDLVADILRINGYSKIPLAGLSTAVPADITDPVYKFEDKLKDIMVSLGYHEHITDPMVKADPDNKVQVKMQNALNSEKSALRTTLYETLFPITKTYAKHGQKECNIFEVSKVYGVDGAAKAADMNHIEGFSETRVLQVIGQFHRQALAALMQNLGVKTYRIETETFKILANNKEVGQLSHDSFWLDTQKLLEHVSITNRIRYASDQRRTEDISLQVPVDKKILGDVCELIKSSDKNVLEVLVVEDFTDPRNKEVKNVLIRVWFDDKWGKEEILTKIEKDLGLISKSH